MNLIEELHKLGGDELVKKFSDTFWIKDMTLFKVNTNKGKEVILPVSTLRKILAGAPEWHNVMKGNVGRNEVANALLRWEVVEFIDGKVGCLRPIE